MCRERTISIVSEILFNILQSQLSEENISIFLMNFKLPVTVPEMKKRIQKTDYYISLLLICMEKLKTGHDVQLTAASADKKIKNVLFI